MSEWLSVAFGALFFVAVILMMGGDEDSDSSHDH